MKRDDRESAGHRHARLSGIILDELRALLRDDVSDPALARARITNIVLSVDYRHARVHFALGGGVKADAEHAFTRATPFLRARIGEAIDLKRVPDLRFVFDGVVADGDGENV